MITFGSVCSGIEAASVAWNPLGWKAYWLAEIEPFPSAVLAHHYPETPNLGDMTTIADKVLSGDVAAPDVLVGGTPCQSFSVAGMRAGLSDERGQLTLEFVRLADAIDTIRRADGKRESVIVWENVPGVLSSKDNAFGCFLAALAGEGCELQPAGKRWSNAGYIIGPKRAIAWRVLDAQYFGVAQRRRRVFVVASARDGFCPAEVLFEFDGVRRDTAPSREAGQATTGNVGAGVKNTGSHGELVGTLCARDFKGVGNQYVSEGKLVVSESIGFRKLTFESYAQDETASTMMARDYKSYTDLVAFTQNSRDEVRYVGGDGQVAGALAANPGMKQTTYLAFNSRQDPVSGDVFGALDTGSPQAQAVTVYPLNTMTMLGRPSDDLKPRMGSGIGKPTDPQNTLSAAHHHAVATATAVRRLTPIECERLQGFEDGHTMIPWRGKPAEDCPDGHRYKALGNSMCVNVMRWIGSRITAHMG